MARAPGRSSGCLSESKDPADTAPAGASLESAAPEKKADNEPNRRRHSYGFPGVLPNVLMGGARGVLGLFRHCDSDIVES